MSEYALITTDNDVNADKSVGTQLLKIAKKIAWYASISFSVLSSTLGLVSKIPIPAISNLTLIAGSACYLLSLQCLLAQTLIDARMYNEKINDKRVTKPAIKRKRDYLKENLFVVVTGFIAALFITLSIVNPIFSIAASWALVVSNLYCARSSQKFQIHYQDKGPVSNHPLEVAIYRERCLDYNYSSKFSALLLLNSINMAVAGSLALVAPPIAAAVFAYIMVSSTVIMLIASLVFIKAKYHAYNAYQLSRELSRANDAAHECSTNMMLNSFSLDESLFAAPAPSPEPESKPMAEPVEINASRNYVPTEITQEEFAVGDLLDKSLDQSGEGLSFS